MKKTQVLSSLVLSGAVLVMAPHAWTQTGGSSGAGSSKSGSESQKSSDPSATGSSSQRGSSSGSMQTDRGGSGSSVQSDRGSEGSARRASAGSMSKEKVKQVQAALKSKGMDPGPEDGVLGPKTQGALREFQKSNNLTATGRIDEKTASALGVDVASSSSGMGSSGRSGS